MRRLYFIKPSRPYNVGEIAGFPKEIAERLVALGAAIPVEDVESEKAKREEIAEPIGPPLKEEVPQPRTRRKRSTRKRVAKEEE